MDRHTIPSKTRETEEALRNLVHKGKTILQLCMEREKNLGMKGFIDSQIVQGGVYLKVVEALKDHIETEMSSAQEKRQQKLLLDLQEYCVAQLHSVMQPPGANNIANGHTNNGHNRDT